MIVSVVIILALVGTVAAFIAVLKPGQKQQSNQKIVQNLAGFENQKGVTCKDVVDKIGNTSVNEAKDYETKVALLERQSQCFTTPARYSASVPPPWHDPE